MPRFRSFRNAVVTGACGGLGQALAGQLAVAIQNASLFSEVQEARAEVETQVQRFTEQGWQDFLNAIQQGQRIGFEFDNRGIVRLTPEELTSLSGADCSNIPMTVTGAQIGTIQLPAD